MDFSKALKQLFEITALKKSALADEIGYDVSYVSHWISGTKKPSFKNNPALPNQIADFFVLHSDISHRRALCQMLKIDVESDASQIHQAILNQIGSKPAAGFIKNCTLVDLDSDYEWAKSRIASVVKEQAEKGDVVLYTIPSLADLDYGKEDDLIERLAFSIAPVVLRQTFVVDPQRYDDPLQLFRFFLYYTKSDPSNYFGQIYFDSFAEEFSSSFFLVRNRLASIRLRVPFVSTQHTLVVQDEEPLFRWQKIIETRIGGLEPVFLRTAKQELVRLRFFYAFLLYERYFAVYVDMFPVFMTRQQRMELIEIYGLPYDEVLLDEMYENPNIQRHIYIFRSVLMRYLVDGKIMMGNHPVHLTLEQRKRHLEHLIEKIRDDPNLQVRILPDHGPVLQADDFFSSIFVNEDCLFMTPADCDEIVYSRNRQALNVLFSVFYLLNREETQSNEDVVGFLERSLRILI